MIHREVKTYYVYNSHSRDIAGFPVSGGTAILLTFDSLKGMNNYIKILAMYLNADKFELTPIEITWKFLNKDIIIAINRQSEALHVIKCHSYAVMLGSTNGTEAKLCYK